MSEGISRGAQLKGILRQKLFELDFLREPAYADKEQSVTRLGFTLFLILCLGGAFAAFFAYYGFNRQIEVKNLLPDSKKGETSVTYEQFLKFSKKSEYGMTCSGSTSVQLIDFLGGTEEAFFNLAGICPDPLDSNFEQNVVYEACWGGLEGIINTLSYAKLPAGTLSEDELELQWEVFTIIWNVVNQVSINHYNNWILSLRTIDLARLNGMFSVGPNPLYANDNYPNYTQIEETVSNSIETLVLNITVNYQDYFELSAVKSCEYFEKQSWFQVFTSALNGTQSFFAVFLFILGITYGIFKKLQKKEIVRDRLSKIGGSVRDIAETSFQLRKSADMDDIKKDDKKKSKGDKKGDKKDDKKEDNDVELKNENKNDKDEKDDEKDDDKDDKKKDEKDKDDSSESSVEIVVQKV